MMENFHISKAVACNILSLIFIYRMFKVDVHPHFVSIRNKVNEDGPFDCFERIYIVKSSRFKLIVPLIPTLKY